MERKACVFEIRKIEENMPAGVQSFFWNIVKMILNTL